MNNSGGGEVRLFSGTDTIIELLSQRWNDADGIGTNYFDPAILAAGDYVVKYSYTANPGLPTECVNIRFVSYKDKCCFRCNISYEKW